MARILLAFDGSDGAIGAVTALGHWDFRKPTEIVLLTVAAPGEWPAAHVSRTRELAARSLRRHGAAVHLELANGDPVDEVLSAVRRHETDLIALGPRKRTALSQILLGSVTRDLLHRCHCSIFVGRLSLSTERAVAVLASRADLRLLARGFQELPLPVIEELILFGVGSDFPEPCHEPPGSIRHGSPEKLPGLLLAEERDHVWTLLDTARERLRDVAPRILANAALGHQVDEILRLEAKTSPELMVLHNTGQQDRLVAEARSSVLLLR